MKKDCIHEVNPLAGFIGSHNGRCARGVTSPEIHLGPTHHVRIAGWCGRVCQQCADKMSGTLWRGGQRVGGSMKIINQTKWQTKHLRAFVSEVMKRAPELLKRKMIEQKYRAKLEIEIKYNKAGQRGGYVCGRAGIDSYWMLLMVGGHEIDRVDLAHVIMHELAHTLGYRHPDMEGNALFMRVGNWREIYAWAEELPLEPVRPKAKPKGAELQTVRYNRVLAAKDRWTAKLKRAQNALRKLNQQERYYANALASRKPKEATDVTT